MMVLLLVLGGDYAGRRAIVGVDIELEPAGFSSRPPHSHARSLFATRYAKRHGKRQVARQKTLSSPRGHCNAHQWKNNTLTHLVDAGRYGTSGDTATPLSNVLSRRDPRPAVCR